MADRRGVIVPLVILAFIFLSPDPARNPPGGRFDPRPTLRDAIAQEQHSLEVLQNSTYSELRFGKDGIALNLTGLEPERNFSWAALPQVQGKARQWLGNYGGDFGKGALDLSIPEDELQPLYRNVTGFVHGEWVRSKLDESVPTPQLNLSQYAQLGPFGRLPPPRHFRRNITGDGGDIKLRFHERERPLPQWLHDVPGNATTMDVEMTISDAESMEEYELRMIGAYFPTVGQAMLTTTSDKFAGIFMLPHLAMSEPMFEASRMLLNESISRTIQRQIDRDTERLNPWAPTLEGAAEAQMTSPECEIVMYLQQLTPSLPNAAPQSKALSFLERELRFPTGAFLPSAPDLKFAMIAFSPDCGYVIESKGPPDFVPQDGDHLVGPKLEVLHNSSRHHLMVFTATLALQLVLLMRQMREASTPSTRSRISLYTIAILALGDGFTTMTFLLISLFIGDMWINLVGTAFLAFVSVSFFGMRFLMDIWTVQAPERARRAREEAEEERRREERFHAEIQRLRDQRLARLQEAVDADRTTAANGQTNETNAVNTQVNDPEQPQSAPLPPPSNPNPALGLTTAPTEVAPNPPPLSNNPAPGFLPLPVTAPRPTDTGATPVFMPSDQEGLETVTGPNTTTQVQIPRESFGALYTRFYILLLLTLFVSLNATSWLPPFRRVYFTSLALAYLSFWIPQLNRNIQRNCRKALNWEYVFGQSILRLVPFAYFYGYGNNVVFAERDFIGLALLAVWVWIQVVLLVSQEIIGPRWFVRSDWAPPAYDYHPVLREDEEGDTLPIGFSHATATASVPTSPITDRDAQSSPTANRRSSVTTKESKEKGKRVFDCAICMQDLEVPIIEAGGSSDQVTGPSGLLARRLYMVTPCRHIFHSACLEGWMKYRLQCPICRETLPPL